MVRPSQKQYFDSDRIRFVVSFANKSNEKIAVTEEDIRFLLNGVELPLYSATAPKKEASRKAIGSSLLSLGVMATAVYGAHVDPTNPAYAAGMTSSAKNIDEDGKQLKAKYDEYEKHHFDGCKIEPEGKCGGFVVFEAIKKSELKGKTLDYKLPAELTVMVGEPKFDFKYDVAFHQLRRKR